MYRMECTHGQYQSKPDGNGIVKSPYHVEAGIEGMYVVKSCQSPAGACVARLPPICGRIHGVIQETLAQVGRNDSMRKTKS